MERTWAPDKGEAPEAVGNYKCQRVRSYDTCDKYEVALIARPLTFNWLNANTVFGGDSLALVVCKWDVHMRRLLS